jgi:hypothetical protein
MSDGQVSAEFCYEQMILLRGEIEIITLERNIAKQEVDELRKEIERLRDLSVDEFIEMKMIKMLKP